MKRLALPFLITVAMCVAWVAGPSQAQQAPSTQAFTLTAAGQASPVIQFSTAISSCGVVVNNGGTFTLVPQSSNDNATWVTATGINSGSISATGSFTGGIASTGLKSFRVSLSAVDSTAVTGTITCSGALARAATGATGAPGPSGAPGPTGPTGPPGSPAPTICPSAGSGISVTGTYPCTVAVSPSPTVTSTACAAAPAWASNGVLSIPAGCSGAGGVTAVTGSGNISVTAGATPNVTITNAPTFTNATISSLATTPCVGANSGLLVPGTSATTSCLVRGSSGNWDAIACHEPSVTHCYTLGDANGSATAADTPTGSAAPSPVPAPTVSPGVVFGTPSISNDGETSMTPVAGGGNLAIPIVDWPTSGSYSVEIVVSPHIASSNMLIWSTDNTNDQVVNYKSTNTYSVNSGGVPFNILEVPASEVAVDIILVCCPDTGPHSFLYIDGLRSSTGLGGTYTTGSLPGSIGWSSAFSSLCFCRIAKFAIYNTALTQAQVWAHVAALGI